MTCASSSSATVKELIKHWNNSQTPAIPREELRKLAKSAGLAVEDYIEAVFTGNSQSLLSDLEYGFDPNLFPWRALACECIAEGYLGKDMQGDAKQTEVRIRAMASGRVDEHDLNQGGIGFWKAVKSHFAWFLTERDMDKNQGEAK
jgi:hypothetical protein